MKNLLKLIGIALLTFTFSFTNNPQKTIVIDVSHGGDDLGATFENYNEKEVVFNVAQQVIELNKNPNIKIVLTRNSDNSLSLEERAEIINSLNPEFVISLHANLHPNTNKKGTEIYISENNKEMAKSKQLALNISQIFENQNPIVKNANFQILRNVESPIALLELGFLSNNEDREKLTSQKGQKEFAEAILMLVERY